MAKVRYQPLGPLLSGEGSRAFLGLEISADAPPLPVALVWVPEEVSREPDAAAKIVRETKRAASLEHPNIIRVHGLATMDEGLARVVEFADGESLRTILNRCRKMPPRLAALVTADAAMGVHYAHMAGNDDGTPLVHGDIRPETLLISFSGVCKVAGYGALGVAPKEQGGKRVQGRRYHCAPEQVLGGRDAINRQTDVYLLGVVLYECLTGLVPFKDDPDFDQAVLNSPLPLLSPEDVPAELLRVMEHATAKKASDRYPTTRALRDAIERAVGILPAHEELETFLRKYYPDDSPARTARRREIEAGIAELARKDAARSRPAAPPAAPPNHVNGVASLSGPLSMGPGTEPPFEIASPARANRPIATYALAAVALLVAGAGAYAVFSGDGSRHEMTAASAPAKASAAAPTAIELPAALADLPEAKSPPAARGPSIPAASQVETIEKSPASAPARSPESKVRTAVAKSAGIESESTPQPSSVVQAAFSPPAEQTSLELSVDPAVEISIDGRAVGRSPVTVPLLAGKHTVLLVDSSRGINVSRPIQVRPKGKTTQHWVLAKGIVEVTAPDGALISIDGKPVGSAPIKDVSIFEGKHRIQATMGTAKWQQAFTVGANERMFFNIESTREN